MRINKEIRNLVEFVIGQTHLKKRVFEQFKSLFLQKKEVNIIVRNARKHMQKWKLYMCLKSWQNIKQYEAKEKEKEEKALKLFSQRRLYRLFNHFKLGIVQSRISYINDKIVSNIHTRKLK